MIIYLNKIIPININILILKKIKMSKNLEGKIAVITAASTGIGLAISQKLAKEGATVIVTSRN